MVVIIALSEIVDEEYWKAKCLRALAELSRANAKIVDLRKAIMAKDAQIKRRCSRANIMEERLLKSSNIRKRMEREKKLEQWKKNPDIDAVTQPQTKEVTINNTLFCSVCLDSFSQVLSGLSSNSRGE